MGRFNTVLCAAAVTLTAGVASAQGIVPDRSTVVTISAPVAVPGVVLPAGEYLFRLADTQASRNVVQIFNKDRSKIFATLIAIPAERMQPSDEAVITFRETPSNQAPALRYWYYAGEKSGQEFAYPKKQAIEIARASNEPVMAVDSTGDDIDSMSKGEMHRVEPNSAEVTQAETAQPAAAAPAATPAEQPPATPPAEPQQPATPTEPQPATPPQPQPTTPAPAEPAAPTTPTPAEPQTAAPAEPARPAATEPQATGTSGREATPAPAGTSGRDELPKTASELPIVTMFGILALGAALGARALRRGMSV